MNEAIVLFPTRPVTTSNLSEKDREIASNGGLLVYLQATSIDRLDADHTLRLQQRVSVDLLRLVLLTPDHLNRLRRVVLIQVRLKLPPTPDPSPHFLKLESQAICQNRPKNHKQR